jgi:hypothetical protein
MNSNSKEKKGKLTSVSIVTLTQLKRFACIEILKDVIKAQTYQNIIEWVIVEGSKTDEDAKANGENIRRLIASSDLQCPILYLEKKSGEKLGGLRNKGNKACSGDITVRRRLLSRDSSKACSRATTRLF